MINCIAIDDEPLALVIMKDLCSKVPQLNLEKTFTDTAEAARHIRKFPVDLIFLDVQMPDMSGLNFYRQHGNHIPVIFSTAHSQFAIDAFDVDAVDYLLKPVDQARFVQAVHKAQEYINYTHSGNKSSACLFVRSEYSLVKVPFNEILYIETLDDYIRIHLANRKPVLTKMNLKNVIAKLDPNDFIRVHRSYIVPLSRITGVRGKLLSLGNNASIPVGVKYEQEFFAKYRGDNNL